MENTPGLGTGPPGNERSLYAAAGARLRVRRVRSQRLAQLRVAGPAHRGLLAVLEERHAAVLGVQLEPGEPLHVEHVGAVDAHEARRVEPGRDLGERLGLEVGPAVAVD